ncbi:MAG: UDP-glucose 4-epimerase GalE [Lachnospirales bacterium]
MSILVVGGAGYIGSHMVLELLKSGEDVIVVDNLITGHKESVDKRAKLFIGDIKDKSFLRDVFSKNNINAVIDFAAYSLVGESVNSPLKYFENNVYGTICLLEVMVEFDVKSIVFSSTAATFGEPEVSPIVEDVIKNPTNPYGESKLCVEKILKWVDNAHGLKYAVLRYFNVAGADIDGKIGEAHTVETHIIPLVLKTAQGLRDKIMIFGDDYNTPDGTCIRDYIHVTDLCNAHQLALNHIQKNEISCTYNLGNGNGFSVKEIIQTCRKVTGIDFKEEVGERRAGDPSTLVASSEKITKELGWKPKYNTLEQIIESAWLWHKANPMGYTK